MICEAVTEFVAERLGVPTEYGEFPAVKGPRAMVKAGAGDPVVRQYVSGGGIYRFPYEVYLLVPATTDEGDRIGGISLLRDLVERVSVGHEVPEPTDGAAWTDHAVTINPHVFSRGANAETIYQAGAQLVYMMRG